VHVLAPELRVAEQRLPRVHVDRAAIAQGEPGGMIHPAVNRDDEQRAGHSGDRDRDPAGEVQPWRQPVPAVGVDPNEDGLNEEREALQREAKAEDVAEIRHPLGPQRAELEGQDRSGDHAHREQRHHDARPPPGQDPVQVIPGAKVTVLGEQDQDREGDPEAHEGNVNREGERLHLACFEQVVLLYAHGASLRGSRCHGHAARA
jgi:hypothetical protein